MGLQRSLIYLSFNSLSAYKMCTNHTGHVITAIKPYSCCYGITEGKQTVLASGTVYTGENSQGLRYATDEATTLACV